MGSMRIEYVNSDETGNKQVKGTGGAPWTLEQGQVGGERNTSSTSNNYDVIKQECNVTRVTGTTETVISASPCYLLGVYANNGASASSGYANLRDASTTGGASTPKIVVRATGGDCPDLKATRFENGLTTEGSAAGTDVSILWRPIA